MKFLHPRTIWTITLWKLLVYKPVVRKFEIFEVRDYDIVCLCVCPQQIKEAENSEGNKQIIHKSMKEYVDEPHI